MGNIMTLEATARPAATILLLRDGADGLEVFMVVRHHAVEFASGALVFPGGRVEETDYELAARILDREDPEEAETDEAETDEPETAALAFRIAAIRETFEECGEIGHAHLLDSAGDGPSYLGRCDDWLHNHVSGLLLHFRLLCLQACFHYS